MKNILIWFFVVMIAVCFVVMVEICERRSKELTDRNPFNMGQSVIIKVSNKEGIVKWKNSQTTCVGYALSTGEVIQGHFNYWELRAKE